uniref:SREBP regulating gene protein n=1 Tax=Ictidomys tridecemlineatus TaxID=43179 RepID=UPI00038BC086|nr:SREBP regulating gene protein [Ictidomys tridecemlineatus]
MVSLQEERAVRDRNLLQVQDHDQPIPWKVQFNLGNSSRPSNQCRNSIQGKHLITDDLGYVCERKDLLTNGCCDVSVPSTNGTFPLAECLLAISQFISVGQGQSVQHENTYRDPVAKYCYGESPPELFPA